MTQPPPRAASRLGGAADLSAFDYHLPVELIAQEPAPRRDASRLMVVDRGSDDVRHDSFAALGSHLRGGDLLVFNDVRVRPARLRGRSPSGGAIELLLLHPVHDPVHDPVEPDGIWECLGRPARRLQPGSRMELPGGCRAAVVGRDDATGRVRVRFAVADVGAYLERYGETPLPPYIKRPRGPSSLDRERYQTVFAAPAGSAAAAVAAPTAGLHFTEPLLEQLRGSGVGLAWLTLHVGPATFLPVRTENLEDDLLEAETASIPAETVRAIAAAKAGGGRVIAVGTTTTRALESRAADPLGLRPGDFRAGIFLREPEQFRVIDGLLTNFHLPKSTLLVLVGAFAGRQRVLAAYAEAVARRYRFYSYGDAMLIL